MTDFILIDNDVVNFLPAFGAATVVVLPGNIKGSGPATLNGQKLCVDGDEKQVQVTGCLYVSPPYVIPGTGTLKIDALSSNQKASKTNTGNKAVLLKGSQFDAKFEVQSPAQQPPPGPGSPIPDSMTQYKGKGMFVTTNMKLQGA
jgi:Contractile injection system spike tip protein